MPSLENWGVFTAPTHVMHPVPHLLCLCVCMCVCRFWDVNSGKCVQETQLEGAADSQFLTCSFSAQTRLLTVGTFAGNLLALKLVDYVATLEPLQFPQ